MKPQDFVVIDLFSQGRAVQRHVLHWPKDEVLTWLRHWGTLDSLQHPGFPETYIFRAWCGCRIPFHLEDGIFTFLGDHAIAVPPE